MRVPASSPFVFWLLLDYLPRSLVILIFFLTPCVYIALVFSLLRSQLLNAMVAVVPVCFCYLVPCVPGCLSVCLSLSLSLSLSLKNKAKNKNRIKICVLNETQKTTVYSHPCCFIIFSEYLTVGLSSVKREKGRYLQDTLQSIFSASSEEELVQMVVVVLLADFDVSWIQQTLEKITDEFHTRLSKGQLLVIHANEDNYPPLTGLKRNFNDAPDRVSFRSKQNVDYSYLLYFSSDLSQYYIMLEMM